MISIKIKKTIEAEIKKLQALVKSLKENGENYGVDNSEAIDRIETDITHYKEIIK